MKILNGYKLIHKGALALADIERNGIKVDIEYYKKQDKLLQEKIEEITDKIYSSKTMRIWKKVYGDKTNINSNTQLADILFNHLDYEPPKTTKKGNPSVDKESLAQLKNPLVKDLLKQRRLKKVKDTDLANIIRQEVDGYIYPSFNLHTVKTFRSSSDSPNFQNMPIRDPVIGKIIRKGIIPREGNQLVEIDYSGLEISIAACYHQDPTMLNYLNDSTKDLHRDMAMKCYSLEKNRMTKEIRYCGKNMFVFPEFYGDYYGNCAKNLWNARKKLKTKDGELLTNHLKQKGYNNFYTFSKHIENIEDFFWHTRFPVYTQWKEDWYRSYLKRGYFNTLTGFKCQGYMTRNDVINYPVQGSAFHCLLWSLIQLNKTLKKKKMKSKIVGQIHDSIVADVASKELNEYVSTAKSIMEKQIKEHWKWIIVPLKADVEITPINGSWNEKEEI